MKVTVKVDSNLKIKNMFEPPLEIELSDGERTLKDLLQKLSSMYPYWKFVHQGEMGDDLRYVFINGESHFSFAEGFRKKVNDGDTVLVEAYMDFLAGG